jgi:hypothetical protein
VPRQTFTTLTLLAAAVAVAGSVTYTPVAEAFGFGDMFNPGRWMGGRNHDRYDDYYDDGPYGGPGWGGPGYGYGGPGYGYGGPGYGVGGPGYGYGAPGYGYGAPAAAPAVPAAPTATAPATTQSKSSSASEIEALKRRIDELEASQRPSGQAPASSDWPSAPAFRPMSKY